MHTTTVPAPLLPAIVELGKPRITAFVLITAAVGLVLADGPISWWPALISIAATGLLVAAANTLNCYIERESDGRMPRTARRVLPSGRIAPAVALASGALSAALAIPVLHFAANALTAFLGLLAFLVYVLAYTPLKRVGPAALEVGAFAGAMPPLMGWTAATGDLDAGGVALFAVLFFWQLPHFLALSLMYREDYRSGGIRTLAVTRGAAVVRRRLPLWAAALTLSSLALVVTGTGGAIYLTVATVLGGAFVAVAWAARRERGSLRWARRAFLYSLAYLPLLLAALVIDAG